MVENYKEEEIFDSIADFEESLQSTDDIKKYNIVKDLIKERFNKNTEIKIDRTKTENNNIISLLSVQNKKNALDVLIIDFNDGTIVDLNADPKKPSADRRTFNVNGLIRGKLLEISDDKKIIGTVMDALKKYEDFLAKSSSNLDTYIMFKEYENQKYLEEIYFIGYDLAMYINCRTGLITQYVDHQNDILELVAKINDKSFIRQECLEEILENMHSHNKPILKSNEEKER